LELEIAKSPDKNTRDNPKIASIGTADDAQIEVIKK
jgi:hypothetical protein